MTLPIYLYETKVLRTKTVEIDNQFPELIQLISNMFDILANAEGVRLAATQIGSSIKIFIIDASPLLSDENNLKNFKKIFINPQIINQYGEDWYYKEGCLCIPGIHEEVSRKYEIRVKYQDENFINHDEIFSGIPARIIQHEYNHLDGILYTDKLVPLKKRLLFNKLRSISKGKVDVKYYVLSTNK